MNESSWIGIIGRVFVWTSVGFALSLLVGTLFSLLPASPVEALHGGVIVTGSLLVLVYFLALKFRGSDRRRSWVFDLHSVLGLATGILLSVIFVTGVLLLYRAEIEAFSNPWLEVSQGTHYASVDEWLGAVDSRTDLNSTNRIDITWPARKDHSIRISTQGTSGFELFYVDPYNAKIIDGQLKSQMGLIRRLHVGLNLGAPGHWVAGLVSLLAIWLCISGLSMGAQRIFRVVPGAVASWLETISFRRTQENRVVVLALYRNQCVRRNDRRFFQRFHDRSGRNAV